MRMLNLTTVLNRHIINQSMRSNQSTHNLFINLFIRKLKTRIKKKLSRMRAKEVMFTIRPQFILNIMLATLHYCKNQCTQMLEEMRTINRRIMKIRTMTKMVVTKKVVLMMEKPKNDLRDLS